MSHDPDFKEILNTIDTRYRKHVDSFRSPDGSLAELLELKDLHTARVVENILEIASRHAPDRFISFCCAASARLHDVGRFEQLRSYGTFRDSDSIDHALLSRRIVEREKWLDGVPGAECILDAVLFHNRRELPPELDDATLFVSNAVRDADKLDIFTVLEDRVKNTDWRKDCSAFWNLPVSAPPNPTVVETIRSGRSVDYRDIKSLSDFVLIQVGWMIEGLHFAATRRMCKERGHLEFRRQFLGQISGDSSALGLCDLAAAALAR